MASSPTEVAVLANRILHGERPSTIIPNDGLNIKHARRKGSENQESRRTFVRLFTNTPTTLAGFAERVQLSVAHL